MTSPPSLTLTARDLRLDRGPTAVLAGVDVSVSSGQRAGLVGPNGVGKSTLLAVLAGRLRPDAGSVSRSPPDAVITLLDQEPARDGTETAREQVARRTGVTEANAAFEAATRALADGEDGSDDRYAAALDRWIAIGAADHDARLAEVLADLGLPEAVLDRPTATLSGGQASRVGLAEVLVARADVLLLDEPTNDLDFDGLDRLERLVRGHPGALVVVSHDRAFLERTVTHVVELDGHARTATTFGGGWAAHQEERATARRHAEEAFATYSATRDELRGRSQQVREWSAKGLRNVKRSGEPDKNIRHHNMQTSEKMAGKAARVDRMLERLEVVDKPFEGWELRMELAQAERSGDVVARLDRAVVVRGEGAGVFRLGPVDLQVGAGDRLVVAGRNGSGKSTLVELLVGRLAPTEGAAHVGPGVRVGEVEQVRHRFTGAGSLLEAFLAETGWTLAEARSLLAKLGLGADHVGRPAGSLSPGERTRASLALLMAIGTNWLVLDEPTNHLDVEAIEQLEVAVETWTGTLLVVSHDRVFLDALEADGTRHLHVEDGTVTEVR